MSTLDWSQSKIFLVLTYDVAAQDIPLPLL